MSDRSAIIVGAGLGGLLCGRILSREGWQVTLLEQGAQAGGALQTFVRDGIRFDTGFHSVGGMGPGEPLEQVFRFAGLPALPWIRMEADEIVDGTGPFLRFSSDREEEKNHILEPYRLGTWRLQGGGKTLVDALSQGQDILLRKKVTEVADHTVSCADGSRYRADIVVSDVHPLVTMGWVRDHVRPAYLDRIRKTRNSPGIFTVYAKLRPGTLPYLNHNIFIGDQVMVHFGEPDENGFARSIDLLAFESPGQAGDDTIVTPGCDRAARAEALIRLAAQRLGDLPGAIQRYWTSTPQTWARYTGTPGGTAYGILKSGPQDYISPQTPLPWLFLTGQNIGLHGVLGTSVSALNTCKSISQ